jgi:hypothetical protein
MIPVHVRNYVWALQTNFQLTIKRNEKSFCGSQLDPLAFRLVVSLKSFLNTIFMHSLLYHQKCETKKLV